MTQAIFARVCLGEPTSRTTLIIQVSQHFPGAAAHANRAYTIGDTLGCADHACVPVLCPDSSGCTLVTPFSSTPYRQSGSRLERIYQGRIP